MRTSMGMKTILLASALLFPALSFAQNLSFKEIEARVLEYRNWLDRAGSNGSRLWVRLDSTKRPHRLYVGEGFQRAGQAAGVASVRKGRLAHPPVSWKNTYKKINKKERQLGLCSAIAATSNKEIIEKRGHKVGKISEFPIIVSNDLEKITKTSELRKTLLSLGLEEDLARSTNIVRVPSGKSRLRGRKKRSALSCLIVVSKNSPVSKLRQSLPGVSVVSVESLSITDLVPGTKPVRLTVYTKNAIDSMNNINTVWSKVQSMVNQ